MLVLFYTNVLLQCKKFQPILKTTTIIDLGLQSANIKHVFFYCIISFCDHRKIPC
jgi:hypothetical protein